MLDGNNKLGLDAEDDEEEEDRINNEYVQQDEDEDDEVSVTLMHLRSFCVLSHHNLMCLGRMHDIAVLYLHF